MSYEGDLRELQARVRVLFDVMIDEAHRARLDDLEYEGPGGPEDLPREEVYEQLWGGDGLRTHAIMVLTPERVPVDPAHLQFRWFAVEDDKILHTDIETRILL